MSLEKIKNLWGIPLVHIKEYSRKHRLFSIITYFVDFIVACITVFAMISNNVSFQQYFIGMVLLCIIFSMVLNIWVNQDKLQACRFYRKHKSDRIEEVSYNLDSQSLFSILYCSGCKRVKQDKSIEYYTELFVSLCSEDYSYSERLMKYLRKYEDESGNVSFFIIKKGKKQFFVDLIEKEIDKNGSDNSGDVTEE